MRVTVADQLGADPTEVFALEQIDGQCRALLEVAAEREWRPAPSDPVTVRWICE